MFALLLLTATAALAAEYAAPAGTRFAMRRPGAESILPGGRIIAPLGRQHLTGPGPFGLAVSPSGATVVSANGGPQRYSLTVLDKDKQYWRARHLVAPWAKDRAESDEDDWRSVFMGLAFDGDRALYASEGNSGRVRLIDPRNGRLQHVFDLNTGGFADSYTGDLALDGERGLLYVVDQANFRLAVIDVRKRRILSSTRVGRLPFAVALSPDRRKAYVTNLGMFEYQAIPGADRKRPRETGLDFPAFGFPSPEALTGARRETSQGPVEVPGLGDPNVRESNSLCALDVSDPTQPRVEAFVRTGRPFGQGSLGPFQLVGPNRPPDAAGQSLDALPRSTWAEQVGTALGGSSPSGVFAAAGMVFVSNAHNDSITVIDASTYQTRAEIPIRIPGLEQFRGVLPLGLAYHAATGWLLVAEAGINAVGVIDTKSLKLLGHLPVGWFPTRVVVDRDNVFVTNAKGHGTGPNAGRFGSGETFQGVFRRGSISIFALPGPEELPRLTARVMGYNGFVPRGGKALELPADIRHVVLIVKENRTFDEVFGDLERASNGRVAGSPALARFGRNADVASPRGTLRSRLVPGPPDPAPSRAPRQSANTGIRRNGRGLPEAVTGLALRGINVTPNHHAMAERFAFSDNFYADSEVSVDGHHWLVGSYPNAWTESSLMASYGGQKDFRLPTSAPGRLLFAQSNSSVHPEEQLEAGTLWHHLERHGLSFRNWGEGFELAGVDEGPGLKPTGARFFTNVPMPDPLYRNTSRSYPQYNMNIPDQYRAAQFIAEVEEKYVRGGEPFPRLLYLHLPNDHLAKPRPEDGYPFEASFMADNDVALGRIVEFLSKTPWWRQMAIFITEDDAQGWVDHIDSHRTVFLLVSPYARRNYVSHVNASFPGMLKTVFRLLGLPPLNLFDAAASDLADCFTSQPDFSPYEALAVDPRLFDPAKAREPLDPQPSPRLDDPAVLREQHQRQRP